MSDVLFESANEGKAFFEAGNYIATLRDVKPAEGGDPQYGPSRQWDFALAPFPGDPEDTILQQDGESEALLWQFSSTKMSPQAKARQWVEALLGRPLVEGENIGKSDLIGQRMVITLTEEKKGDKMRAVIAGVRKFDPNAERREVRTRSKVGAQDPRSREDNDLPF